MKMVEFLGMAAVDCPCLKCIKQVWQEDCIEYLKFGFQAHSPAFPHI